MHETLLPNRRRLLAGLASALLVSACTQSRAEPINASPPALLPPEDAIAPTVFLTLTSATRSASQLEDAVRSILLPVLAEAGVARASGPGVGMIQLWLELDLRELAPYAMDVDAGLAALAAAVNGTVAPVPGHHRMQAWALHRPQTLKEVKPQEVSLLLPGRDYAPLSALGSMQFALAPLAWAEQATVTVLLESNSRLDETFLQRCEAALLTAGTTVPDDLEIQLGRVGEFLKAVPDVYVRMADSNQDAQESCIATLPGC
ncbi:hypothetical protein [Stenotrophomonas sp.]|uniref:hypothetical protein n=1 Tax=Stenotrophomonas sp. TaxID=69392 RepID=UPI0028AFA942|nr:hypothetical protein [Stenotrophomonas sp.]